jgi:hypothetical protein
MLTNAQSNVMGRGMVATVARHGERTHTVLVIEHEPQVIASEVLRVVKHAAVTSGLLKPGRHTIQIGEHSGDMDAALTASEAHVERLRAEVERLRQQLREQDERADRQPVGAAPGEKYVSIREAALALGKSYATIHRAVKAGEIVAQEKPVEKHSNWGVLVSTYRPKPGKVRKT